MEYKKKNETKKLSVLENERVYIRLLFLYKYCLHVEIIPANMGARQVQGYYNMGFFLYKETTTLRHNTVIAGSTAS